MPGGIWRGLLHGGWRGDSGRSEDGAAGALDLAPQRQPLAILLDFHHLQAVQVLDHVGPLEVLAVLGQEGLQFLAQHQRQERAEDVNPDRPHAGAQDELPASLVLLQCLDRLLADHAPVRHDADLGNAEPAAEPIDHRDERRDVGRVAGPPFTAAWSPLCVEHGPDDHLLEVRPVVLAVSTRTDRLSPLSLDVDGGRIEEDQLELSE